MGKNNSWGGSDCDSLVKVVLKWIIKENTRKKVLNGVIHWWNNSGGGAGDVHSFSQQYKFWNVRYNVLAENVCIYVHFMLYMHRYETVIMKDETLLNKELQFSFF